MRRSPSNRAASFHWRELAWRAGQALLETARGLRRETALILLDRTEAEKAIMRAEPAVTKNGAGNENSPDSEEISVDGLTCRTVVDDLDFAG